MSADDGIGIGDHDCAVVGKTIESLDADILYDFWITNCQGWTIQIIDPVVASFWEPKMHGFQMLKKRYLFPRNWQKVTDDRSTIDVGYAAPAPVAVLMGQKASDVN